MRTSIFALGFLAIGLSHCAGDRGLFVGDERNDAGNGGEGDTASGGTSSGKTGGAGGTANAGASSGGTENTGGSDRGGSGSGAEGGEPSETGGTGGSDRGGTDAGGTDAGGTNAGGLGGDAMRGGAGGNGADAGSGTAARGGMNDGGRAGSGGASTAGRAGASNAGAGGASDTDCEALGREYLQRLAAAQQCSPQLTIEQCTIEMPDDFFCPCKTYVNPMRESDIRRLNEILQKKPACGRLCPAIACPDFKRGVCSAGTIDVTPGRCSAATM